MIRFECDYAEGAHPKIYEKLLSTNLDQMQGYGLDPHSSKAKALIRQAILREDGDIHFFAGGTQTNLTVISHILRPHQSVISAESGHIFVHETGAIEATGHKVIALPSKDGKITAAQVKSVYENHYNDETREHIPQPGMVYISHPTENGTTYTREELKALSDYCHSVSLPLYLDGARLGYATASPKNDLTLPQIAALCDLFYIGGTKIGPMMGEALVIVNDTYKKDFRYTLKQKGAMLAKGRMLGVQFEALFEDDLYMKISEKAVTLALKIRSACEKEGYSMLYDSVTNQQFPILPNALIDMLLQKYAFYRWAPVDEALTAVRFCTSWATKEEHVNSLIHDIQNFK